METIGIVRNRMRVLGEHMNPNTRYTIQAAGNSK